MGASICQENRCLLMVKGDAGRPTTSNSPNQTPSNDSSNAPSEGGGESTFDAGN
jgi:hypothetical protein